MARWTHLLLLTLPACATLADSGGGDANMPNAGAGPFREIAQEELGNTRVAPYALRDDDDFPRDASVLDLDADPATLEAWAYVAHTVFADGVDPDPSVPPNEIIRHHALDGRSFDRFPVAVLAPEQAWEGGSVGAPSALWVDDQVWLYYAADGGIGLARSDDGQSFSRAGDAPVLSPGGSWEQGAVPTSPAVVRLSDGSFQMFYEVALSGGSAIGEARSSDGLSWTRIGDGPALSVGAAGGADEAGVGSPFAMLSTSVEGREIEQLYHGAIDANGKRTVGLAARVGTEGPFQRATAPVFGSSGSLDPREPCVVRHDGFTLLFATQRAGSGSAQGYPAVAIGVAPATVTLPAPDPP